MKNNNVTADKRGFTERFTDIFERVMPDSMTIAFILVIIIALLAKFLAGAPVFESNDS